MRQVESLSRTRWKCKCQGAPGYRGGYAGVQKTLSRLTGDPTNRYATHFFMVQASDAYRQVTGEDITEEDLDLYFLNVPD